MPAVVKQKEGKHHGLSNSRRPIQSGDERSMSVLNTCRAFGLEFVRAELKALILNIHQQLCGHYPAVPDRQL